MPHRLTQHSTGAARTRPGEFSVTGRCAPGNAEPTLTRLRVWPLGAQRLGNQTLDATCSPANRPSRSVGRLRRASARR